MTEYADLIAEGLADERELVLVDRRRADRAVVTLSEPERLNRSAPDWCCSCSASSSACAPTRLCVPS